MVESRRNQETRGLYCNPLLLFRERERYEEWIRSFSFFFSLSDVRNYTISGG